MDWFHFKHLLSRARFIKTVPQAATAIRVLAVPTLF